MNRWMVMNQTTDSISSAYSPAYLDAKNVFILPSIMTRWEGLNNYNIKDVKI